METNMNESIETRDNKTTRIPEEKVNRILELAETKEYTISQIAKIVNEQYSVVYKTLEKNKILDQIPRTKILPEKRNEILRLARTKKYTTSQIAEKVGVLYSTAYNAIKRYHLLQDVRKPEKISSTKIPPEIREQIIKLAKTKKHTVSEIAKEAGVQYAEAYSILRNEKLLEGLPKYTKTISDRTKQIIELAKTKKYTVSEIAKEVGIIYPAVYEVLRKNKLLDYTVKHVRQTSNQTKQIIELAKTKRYTVSEIARIKGISYYKVYDTLKRNNMLDNLLANSTDTGKNKLELQDKVNAIKMYLCGKDFSMIARGIGCEISIIEDYLNSIKLSKETLGLLHDNKVSSEYISNKYGIPINLVNDWRAVIAKEEQRKEKLRNNRIEIIALKLRNELSEEDINLIKSKLDELDVSINDLISIVESKTIFKIEQAIILTENATRFNIPRKSIVKSVIDNYIERGDYGKALRYLGIYSKEIPLEEKNKIISYVQNAKDENER